ncbi:MAG: hypothetical protein ACOYLI_11855 [Synechococcus lacustris]
MEPTLEQRIESAHGDAERIEDEARQIEARICQIPGADRMLPVRTYGRPVSGEAISKNLTLRSLISERDPRLASYLGVGSGSQRRNEAHAAAREAAALAMATETERLRELNKASAKYRERASLAGVNPTTNRRWGF